MTPQTRARRNFVQGSTIIALAAACALPLIAQGQTPVPPPLPKPPVAAAALERLLPALTGWTKARTGSNRIDLSETCAYTYVYGVYTNGAMKVRITLADTAADPEALGVVAPMVVTFPDDYAATIDGSSVIKRLTLNGLPAAMRWRAGTLEGEFVVVIGGRFVVSAEGEGIESIDVLRGFVEQVDLKALAALR